MSFITRHFRNTSQTVFLIYELFITNLTTGVENNPYVETR